MDGYKNVDISKYHENRFFLRFQFFGKGQIWQ